MTRKNICLPVKKYFILISPCIRILAHSHHNRIPFTIADARAIEPVFSSEIYLEKEATLSRVTKPPLQILHIAAHGCHRIDKPDFSFILLEDQHVYTIDFLQMNLDYELVTLSACDTGQLKITACEETIGLCRSILLAGAKATLLSLWKVDDEANVALILFFYTSLAGGQLKAGPYSRHSFLCCRRIPVCIRHSGGLFNYSGILTR